MFRAEIEHFLCLPDAADQRAAQRPAPHDQREGRDRGRFRRHAEKNHSPFDTQESEVGVVVVRRGDGVDDQVEGVREPGEGRFIRREAGLAGITGSGLVASIGGKGQVPKLAEVMALLDQQMQA